MRLNLDNLNSESLQPRQTDLRLQVYQYGQPSIASLQANNINLYQSLLEYILGHALIQNFL